jgi:O-antigen/teichoic acid export membrane protein
MRVQLAWTMLTEMLVMISSILLLKLAASLLGPLGFGEYALSRRAINLLYLPLVLGLGIAAPRYIAIVRAGALPEYAQSSFVIATLSAGLIPVFAVVLLLNLAPASAAVLLFGTGSLAHLVPPSTAALAGAAMHGMAYAIYRGQLRMAYANTLQLLNFAIVPVTVFAFADRGAAFVLLATGIAWVTFSGLALLHVLISERTDWRGIVSLRQHLRVLLRFGVPRVPGEFALVGLFAIPALIAVRAHGVVVAGQFSAAMSILTIVAGVFAPVGLVILPRVSAQAATGDLAGVRRLVLRILVGGILLAAGGVLAGEMLLPFFVRWYFGDAFTPAIPVFRACLLGAIPYAAYVLMRNILDALDVKAINSRNLIVSLAALSALCLIDTGIMWMSGSLVASLVLLGTLTLRDTYTRLRSSAILASRPIPA